MSAIILRRRSLGRGSANGIEAASTTGIKAVRNWVSQDWTGHGGLCDPLLVFRWGCTSTIPGEGMQSPIVVVNTAESIHWCSDKRRGRMDMQAASVLVPWSVGVDADGSLSLAPAHTLGSAMYIGRPSRHAQGRNLVCGGFRDVCRQVAEWGGGYMSVQIAKVAEYRVFVCQGRVVWVAQKTPGNPDDVAWNVAQGGRFDNVRWTEWPMAVVKEALAAANVSDTDFSGVDVMVDAEGRAYVLEVNSAPSQTSPYRQQCVAKAFDYIVTNGIQHFPTVEMRRTWKDVIHPALRQE